MELWWSLGDLRTIETLSRILEGPWKLECKNIFKKTANMSRGCKPAFDHIHCTFCFCDKNNYKLVFLNILNYHISLASTHMKFLYYVISNILNFQSNQLVGVLVYLFKNYLMFY